MQSNKNIFIGSILFFILLVFFFREYLYTYRMMLVNFVPHDLYQNQLLYFSTFEDSYKLTLPSAVRFLPILFYFILYKFIPCLTLTNINPELSKEFICATNAVALGNYLVLMSLLVVFLFYIIKILKRPKEEAYLSLILCFAIIKYLDHFTIDRFVVLYLLLILFFLKNVKCTILLILISFLVSEKIFFITGGLFCLRYIFNKKKENLIYFIFSIIASIFYYFLIKIGKNYFDFFQFDFNLSQMFKMFYDKSAFSGSLIPLLIALSPYIFWNNEINQIYKNQRIEFLIPISLVFFGLLGGIENTARYVSHSFPIWLPILATRINQLLKYIK